MKQLGLGLQLLSVGMQKRSKDQANQGFLVNIVSNFAQYSSCSS